MARGQQVFSPPCITLPPSFTTPPPACAPNVKPFLRFHTPCLRYFPPTPLRLHTRGFHEATNRLTFSDLTFLDIPSHAGNTLKGPKRASQRASSRSPSGPFRVVIAAIWARECGLSHGRPTVFALPPPFSRPLRPTASRSLTSFCHRRFAK